MRKLDRESLTDVRGRELREYEGTRGPSDDHADATPHYPSNSITFTLERSSLVLLGPLDPPQSARSSSVFLGTKCTDDYRDTRRLRELESFLTIAPP